MDEAVIKAFKKAETALQAIGHRLADHDRRTRVIW